ncbi:MAG TPA: hypothetical protein VHZ97_26735, partial [Pseudonocardiaceae bacterium]|nr:hypothetical protein [Pseudonocardiaceae bacterium]
DNRRDIVADGSFTRWRGNAPLWQLFLLIAVIFGGVTWLGHPGQSIVWPAIGGILFGLLMTGMIAIQRWGKRRRSTARQAGVADETELNHAINQGVVPADRGTWPTMERLIEQRRRRSRWELMFGPVVFGLFVLASGYLLVTEGPWPNALYVLVFVGLCVFSVVQPIMHRHKLDRMTALLADKR